LSSQWLIANFVSSKISAEQKNVAWSKPVQGSYKMNVDTSFFSDGSGVAGVVLRNYRGEVVAGQACLLENVLNATAAEALAFLRGLELLEQLSYALVVIESDSMESILACNGEMEIWSPHSAILIECL
jgi:ribonuclease HI